MIATSVFSDEKEIKEIIGDGNLPAGCAVIRANDDGAPAGFAAVRMEYSPERQAVVIDRLEYTDEGVGELLARAAVSYGERRGAITAEAAPEEHGRALERAGFRLIERVMFVEISNVVHMCRNCAAAGN